MAIIYCSNCGKRVSDKAAVCPHCHAVFTDFAGQGAPTPASPDGNSEVNRKTVTIVAIIAVAAVLMCILAVILIPRLAGSGTAGETSAAGSQTQSTPFDSIPEEEPEESAAVENTSIVTLHFSFDQNLFFNQYDVTFYIDDILIDTIPYGKDYSCSYRIDNGTHTLTFHESGKKRVSGETTFKIDQDSDFYYEIHCGELSVKVNRSDY